MLFYLKRLGILVALVVLSTSHIRGQVLNVEQYRRKTDTSHVWKGNINFGFSATRQQTKLITLSSSLNLSYFSRNIQYLLLNSASYLKLEQRAALSDGSTHFRMIFNRRNTFKPEFYLQYNYNYDWGLRRRALTGVNLKFPVFDTKNFNGSISSGFMVEHEVWRPEKGNNILRTLLKSTTSINFRGRITKSIGFVMISYYQAQPHRFLTPRITADWKLQFKISENLKLANHLNATFDAKPVIDVNNLIYSYTTDLVISF